MFSYCFVRHGLTYTILRYAAAMPRTPLSLTILVVALFATAGGAGEVVRLPTVMPPGEPYEGRFTSHPEAVVDLTPLEHEDLENIWNRPIDARNGFFQEAFLDTTWLSGGSDPDDLGEMQVELKGRFALPLPSKRHPLLLAPGFAVHYLEGPSGRDLPPRLFDAYLQFRWLHKLSPRWSAEVSVTPGVYSDFQQQTNEALRISGHFGAMWDWTPTTKLALGVAYLDRQDLRILPVAGVVWEPSPDVQFELMVPRPRIARRYYWSGALGDNVQDWVYVAGELGGGSWAFEHADGLDDVVTYRDLRLILGLERRVLFGVDYRLELAYVFGRRLKFDATSPDLTPTDTILLRLGATF
ncbi:MAG: hypothetical protein JW809_05600 [Pirellulales bacterium]|nr:hypothetical protein [Pirellulales bacterium]